MKVTSVQNHNCFKSGLNKKILLQEQSINPAFLENIFTYRYGIESKFLNNKSVALANKYCLSIFCKLSQKLNIKLAFPPSIFVYNKHQLIDKSSTENFCTQETSLVLKNEYPFLGRSIFFRNCNNLQDIDFITELKYRKNKISSSHFLSPFIHEWLHSFHLDMIYKTLGYGGNCKFMQQIYPSVNQKQNGVNKLKELETIVLSDKENEVVYNTIGEYATYPINQYQEIFSETFTKFICNSLKGIELVSNPLDQLYKTNKAFQEILNKILQLK